MSMTALFFVGLGWWALALLFGLFLGLWIREADRRDLANRPEQPADADTARLDVWA